MRDDLVLVVGLITGSFEWAGTTFEFAGPVQGIFVARFRVVGEALQLESAFTLRSPFRNLVPTGIADDGRSVYVTARCTNGNGGGPPICPTNDGLFLLNLAH